MYGYILDGFPKNSKQAEKLFQNFEKNGTMPNSIIIFDNVEEDFLINRIKSNDKFPKDPKDPQANVILERANRRLGKIKENKTQKEYIDLVDYFKNNEKFSDKVLYLDTKKEIIDLVKESQEFIIKNNNNKINQTDELLNCNDYLYDYIKEQELKKQKEEEELLKQQQIEENKNNPQINKEKNNEEINEDNKNEENKEKEINAEEFKDENNENDKNIKNEDLDIEEENKEERVKTKEEIEKENTFKLLEKKSEVIRRYLSENVLPLLSLGILQVATERPDDPVEALADFLLDKTLELEKKENEDKNKEIKDIKENKTEIGTISNKDE
jgi:adenylate kinase family enzyme